MTELTYNEIQLVQPNQAALFRSSWGFPFIFNQGIFHQGESGIVTLRGIVNNPYKNLALYQVTFNGNITLATGATGTASVAIARNGEPIQTSRAIANTTAGVYDNVTSTAFIVVPRGCNFDISVENTSVSATPATVPAPEINIQNANLVINRIG